jgi:hypothetical protein
MLSPSLQCDDRGWNGTLCSVYPGRWRCWRGKEIPIFEVWSWPHRHARRLSISWSSTWKARSDLRTTHVRMITWLFVLYVADGYKVFRLTGSRASIALLLIYLAGNTNYLHLSLTHVTKLPLETICCISRIMPKFAQGVPLFQQPCQLCSPVFFSTA